MNARDQKTRNPECWTNHPPTQAPVLRGQTTSAWSRRSTLDGCSRSRPLEWVIPVGVFWGSSDEPAVDVASFTVCRAAG